jgi:hypothetical protein
MEELQARDEEVVKPIQENLFLQFLLGLQGFQVQMPFDSAMLVDFSHRLSAAVIKD